MDILINPHKNLRSKYNYYEETASEVTCPVTKQVLPSVSRLQNLTPIPHGLIFIPLLTRTAP